MALELKLNIKTSGDCKNLVISEASGAYSETNPTGWGNTAGPNPTSTDKVLIFTIQCYFNVTVSPSGETKVINPIAVFSTEMSFYANFVIDNDVADVRMVIPHSELYIAFYNNIQQVYGSLGLTVAEKNYVLENLDEWESVQDHVYVVGAGLYGHGSGGDNIDYNTSTVVQFNSICNIQNKVDEYLTTLDFRCEDCDDQDIKDVAFYNVLLQNLKNA